MPGHDIIVIGSSAGGLKALTALVGNLPADMAAALFVVQHLSPQYRSVLPEILSDTGALPAKHPANGEAIVHGRIYVAPPDHHLLLERGHMRLVRGPRENLFRPAVDALFRSAARAYGPRVVGVVLTGHLDDGTVGLQAIKQQGGISVVQDPAEAEFPSMPSNALRYAKIDYCLPLAQIPELLLRLAGEPVAEEEAKPEAPGIFEIEADIAEQQMDSRQLIASVEAIGSRTLYTCPSCNGALWEIGQAPPLRFRCHIGHSFTAGTLRDAQTRNLENALWSAVRLMEEKATMAQRMGERRRALDLPEAALACEDYARNLQREMETIRRLILDGFATRGLVSGEEEA